MKLDVVREKLGLEYISGDESREWSGVYCGDLLSWVMSHAVQDEIWLTIMSNINVVAVASLVDTACVIIAEGVEISDEVKNAASDKEITLYRSEKSVYELASLLYVLEMEKK